MLLIGVVACVALAWKVNQPERIPVRVNSFLVARSAAVGEDGVDVVGVVDELLVPTLPGTVDLTVVVSVTPDRVGRSYAVMVLRPGDHPSNGGEVPLTVMPVAGRPTTTIRMLPRLGLERSGELRLRLRCDGVVIAERVLVVRPTPG
jgi:RNA 3'-terminal phosphate cyclase